MVVDAQFKAPLKSPLSVCVWISDCCNLECKYCYAMPFSGNFMSSDRLLSLVDELINLDVLDLSFAGGEPMMHPSFFDILEKLSNTNVQIAVLTNGVNLNKKHINKLRNLFDERGKFLLQVSLDSICSEENDTLRGKGKNVLKNIELASDSKFDIQISTVLTKNNIKNAHLLIEKFYPKVKRFHFLNVQRTEKSLEYPEMLIDENESRVFWDFLAEYSQTFPDDLDLPSLNVTRRSYGTDDESELHQTASFDCKTCSAGITHVNITHDFDVLGCDIAKDYSNIGNVENQPFENVWHSKKAFDFRCISVPACTLVKRMTRPEIGDTFCTA